MPSLRRNQLNDDVDIMLQVTRIWQTVQRRIGLTATLQPLWFRGLSEIQLNAVDGLQPALGDDILQGTTYRTYRKLAVLGVTPPPPQSDMRLLLRMSRGNDVAFLWFLMEMFYKTCYHEINYQLNEQIIMSAIFWLDLFPTLNELDQLLPQPHKSVQLQREKKYNKNEREESQKWQVIKKQSQELALIQPKLVDPSLPYFQKLRWPKPRRSRLFAVRPRKQTLLPTKPTAQGQSTLGSRWFGAYRFSASERVAKDVLIKEIDNILMELGGEAKSGKGLAESIKFTIDRIRQDHRKLITNDVTKSQERTRRRILDQLERLTEKYTAQLRAKQTAGHISKSVDSDFVRPEDVEDELICGLVDSNLGFHLSDKTKPPACRDHIPKKTTCTRQCFNVKDFDEPLPERECLANGQGQNGPALLVDTGTEKDRMQSKESSQCQCKTGSDFFKFGPAGSLYNFNFATVFRQPRDKAIKDEAGRLRAEYLKAFGEDIDFQNKVLNNETSGSLDKLVDRSAKRLFQESSKHIDEKYEEHEKLTSKKTESENLFKLESETYDPDNIGLMRTMLRKGLDNLAEDRRFILPTLPDVHYVPLLIEWIRARYGKRYSHEEKQKKYLKDKMLMNNVMLMLREIIFRIPTRIRLPKKTQKNTPTFVTHTVNRLRLAKLRHQHMKKFSIALAEMGRIFYVAMNAHMNTPPSSRFHAYMPTHIRDLHICAG